MKPNFAAAGLALIGLASCLGGAGAQEVRAVWRPQIVDAATGKRLAANVFLLDSAGKLIRPPDAPFWRDHFSTWGSPAVDLGVGVYQYEIERGPCWRPASGEIRIKGPGEIRHTVELQQRVDLRKEGWRSGETHIHRPFLSPDSPPAVHPERVDDPAELLLRAGDLDFGQVISWWNKTNPWDGKTPKRTFRADKHGPTYDFMAGEDEREGGALLYFGLKSPLPIQDAARDSPPSVRYLWEAHRRRVKHVDVEKPFWWDLPFWLVHDAGKPPLVHTIGIANNHMHRSGVYPGEAWGRSRDQSRYPGTHGNGLYTQDLYYKVLDAGEWIPPSAGSASGVLPNPVGYNRIYAHVGKDASWDGFWTAVREGRSFVTNGPLLRVEANGEKPGAHFKLGPDGRRTIKLRMRLDSLDPNDRVEVIHNGRYILIAEMPVGKWTPLLTFQAHEPGWFLVRAIAKVDHTFRFASTAPFYIEGKNGERRISRSAVRFFRDWQTEREGRLKTTTPEQRREWDVVIARTREFWQRKLNTANAE